MSGNPLRVTHVITRLIVGGAQENTVASVLGLRRRGLQVELISGPSTGAEGSLENLFTGCPETLQLLPQLRRAILPWSDWIACRRLKNRFLQTRPDLVHTHSGKAGLLGRWAASQAGVPLIVHTIHGPSFGAFQGLVANTLFRAAERRAARVTTHFVTVAHAMRDQYLAAGIGSPEMFTRVLSGFPIARFLAAPNSAPLRARWGFEPATIIVGKIGRLVPLKGHDELLQMAPKILQRHPQVRFLIIGDGPLRSSLQQRCRTLGLHEQFRFTGLVAPPEMPALVGMMDILAHLSRREGLARALPQALAAGKPVVAYDCDGAREVCLSGQTGFLIPLGNRERFAEAIIEVANNASLRHEMGRRGQELVRDEFTEERMVEDLHALYERLATSAAGRGKNP